jgi:hypothetical protein
MIEKNSVRETGNAALSSPVTDPTERYTAVKEKLYGVLTPCLKTERLKFKLKQR